MQIRRNDEEAGLVYVKIFWVPIKLYVIIAQASRQMNENSALYRFERILFTFAALPRSSALFFDELFTCTRCHSPC
jgi:hypothetical protein